MPVISARGRASRSVKREGAWKHNSRPGKLWLTSTPARFSSFSSRPSQKAGPSGRQSRLVCAA